ncbi:unnamed protein product [Brugia pahangi]|nr:unnamed protein product [Brugia pahangi]
MLSNSQKLPGLRDITTIAKIFYPQHTSHFLPKLPFVTIPKRTKLYGLPPLPNHSTGKSTDMEEEITTESPIAPNRTTIAPLLRLFTLPLIKLPPPPNIDTYGWFLCF